LDLDAALEASLSELKTASRVELPPLVGWNSDLCERHADGAGKLLSAFCADCGIPSLRDHQTVGVAWLYLRRRAVLADSVGTGKTVQALALLALMRQMGELSLDSRALLVVRANALGQWQKMTRKCLPEIPPLMLQGGNPRAREAALGTDWLIALTTHQTMLNDAERLAAAPLGFVLFDDVDPLRNEASKTHKAARAIADGVERVVVTQGTPLQKRLMDMYSHFRVLDMAYPIFGSIRAFERRYLQKQDFQEWVPSASGRLTRRRRTKVVGYRNVDEFKTLIEPWTLRRTDKDITDVSLPAIQPNPVYLDLYPAQRERYEELRSGVLRTISELGEQASAITALGALHAGARICVGLEAVDSEEVIDLGAPETSCKLDWLSAQLQEGGLFDGEDKVVVFGRHLATIEAVQRRLDAADVGHVTVWGQGDTSKEHREATISEFWHDTDVRFLLGTQAIEQSLNLQVAAHIVCLDTFVNPARMEQLVGRIRRDGSPHDTVHVHFIWTNDTQESGYSDVLAAEQAVIDYVWDEETEMFERLSPLQLLQLIVGDSGRQ